MAQLESRAPSLAHLRVVERGRGIAAAYCGKVLADFGAQVTRIARPAHADPHRDGPRATRALLDAAKRVIAVDEASDASREEAAQALRAADIVIDDWTAEERMRAARDTPWLAASNPRAVVVSVTPFGQTGPYAGHRGGDLEVSFLSGLSHLTPRDIAKPANGSLPPPLKMPGSLVSFYAGASAAGAALTGLFERDRAGAGVAVDVSMLEALIPTLRREIALQHYDGETATRFMRVWRLAPYGVKPCKDGFVFLQVVEKYHWEGLVEMMGRPEWALDPQYLDPEHRFQHRHDIEARMAPWLLTQSKAEFAVEAQGRGVPFAPVNEPVDLLRIPQLHERGFFRGVAFEGRAALVPGTPFVFRRPAPGTTPSRETRAVSRGSGRGPLDGLRVIDFGHVWAGPYCAALLADMGAEVIKVESRHRVDIHRRQGPYPDRKPGLNRSGVWNSQNRGKKSVTLNLSTDEGRRLARELVIASDVVIENFAPGVMKRLGLDYASLSAANPGLVMASLSAFGQEGPQKAYVGYGPSLDAWSGLDFMTAYRDGGPNALGGVFPDTGSAIHGAAAILAALHDRGRTGLGTYIDVSELEVSILLLGDVAAESFNGPAPRRQGNGDAFWFPHGCFACEGEDAWVALSVPDASAWRGLCAAIGRDEWAEDATLAGVEGRIARAPEIEAAIAAGCGRRGAREAMNELQSRGVPAGMANTPRTLLADPHLAARGFFEDVAHPEAGTQPLYGPIWRMGSTAARVQRPAPLIGADTEDVLRDVLGVAPGEIARLAQAQVAY